MLVNDFDLETTGEPDTSKGVRPVRRGDVWKPTGETLQGATFLPNRHRHLCRKSTKLSGRPF